VKPDGLIAWPADPREGCAHYLSFATSVIDAFGLEFDAARADPRLVARHYVDGSISEDEYRAEALWWWERVEAIGGVRDFSDPETLRARLALCLLGATPDRAPLLGDMLSWFLELLCFLGFKAERVDPMVERYFTYRDS
jgi:hypothetical protein